MALFKVNKIIDGRTIQVSGWKVGDSYKGSLVNIQGYEINDPKYEPYVINKLKNLLEGKSVELKNVLTYEKGETEGNDIVFCRVYLDEIDIATYFSELKNLPK
jgi:hypothetical protein